LEDAAIAPPEKTAPLRREANELTAILVTVVKKAKHKPKSTP